MAQHKGSPACCFDYNFVKNSLATILFGIEKTIKSIGQRNHKLFIGYCEDVTYVHGHKKNFQKIKLRFYK